MKITYSEPNPTYTYNELETGDTVIRVRCGGTTNRSVVLMVCGDEGFLVNLANGCIVPQYHDDLFIKVETELKVEAAP